MVNIKWHKVDSKTAPGFRFEQTFRVKKICVDEDIIERFISGYNSSLVSYAFLYHVCNIIRSLLICLNAHFFGEGIVWSRWKKII